MLDYRKCGQQLENGEPSVVHVDREDQFKITLLVPDFASFVKRLRAPEYDDLLH